MSKAVEIHHSALPARRIASLFVAFAGVVVLISAFTNNLFSVGPDFEEMIDDFRPALAEESIATARSDLAMLDGVGLEFQTGIVPVMSEQLGMTPEEFTGFTTAQYPDVANGLAALPEIVPTFDGLITTLDSQRDLFESADAIPTESLPATTVPWAMLATGIALLAGAALLHRAGWLGLVSSASLGVGIVASVLVLSLIPKAADADELNDNLRPVYTPELVAQANGAVVTVGAMGAQLQNEMLPDLALQLDMTEAELNGFLGQNFPATASALEAMPGALGRFGVLTETFDSNLDNYNTVEPVSFLPIIWTLLGSGIVTLVASAWAWRTRPEHKVAADTAGLQREWRRKAAAAA